LKLALGKRAARGLHQCSCRGGTIRPEPAEPRRLPHSCRALSTARFLRSAASKPWRLFLPSPGSLAWCAKSSSPRPTDCSGDSNIQELSEERFIGTLVYPVAGPASATLTVREREADPRVTRSPACHSSAIIAASSPPLESSRVSMSVPSGPPPEPADDLAGLRIADEHRRKRNQINPRDWRRCYGGPRPQSSSLDPGRRIRPSSRRSIQATTSVT
jgi:hypothetical protein